MELIYFLAGIVLIAAWVFCAYLLIETENNKKKRNKNE